LFKIKINFEQVLSSHKLHSHLCDDIAQIFGYLYIILIWRWWFVCRLNIVHPKLNS